MNAKISNERLDALFTAILSLRNIEECYDFFEDLCTISEIQAMEQRFHVAVLLSKGKVYSDIVKETGASTATISRVNRCLSYGTDGYKLAIERMRKNAGI